MYDNAKSLSIANLWVAFIAFFAALFMGLYQVAERSGLFPEWESVSVYFASVSTHGVLMGFVLTTFLIMGFGYYTCTTSLRMSLWNKTFSWIGFIVTIIGTLLAAYALLTGQASVLFTFYPPLMAHALFYIGATLLVVGSWFWAVDMIVMTMRWKKANPDQPVPLVQFGNTANAIMWLWTSLGVASEVLLQILPWSLGWIDTIDVGLARSLFAWTLHAIVYFWLFPAYLALYTILPKVAGGRLFSDEMARVSFILLMVFSVPIGFHHLYMDPFIDSGWKFLHMLGTMMVALPTLFTGFTILASLEIAGRLNGGKGLFGWIWALPWHKPMMTAAGLSLFTLIFGGFGGLINASYAMNTLIHNTAWVTAHFHLIFGGTVVLMYFAIGYHLWPKFSGKALFSNGMARIQLWIWFLGMFILTIPWHWIGLLGQPRRISSTPYDTPLVAEWQDSENMMIVGATMLVVSGALFVLNLFLTHFNKTVEENTEMEYAEAIHPPLKLPKILNGFALWNWILFFYLLASYGYPIFQFFVIGTHGAFPWTI
jgi:cytochrome c oxidase subunit 1